MLDSVVRYLIETEVPKRLTLTSGILFFTGIATVALFLAITRSAKADMQIDRTGAPAAIGIWITGTIKESDAKELHEISNELENVSVFDIWLDSKGGDVSTAIKIGKLVRKYDGRRKKLARARGKRLRARRRSRPPFINKNND